MRLTNKSLRSWTWMWSHSVSPVPMTGTLDVVSPPSSEAPKPRILGKFPSKEVGTLLWDDRMVMTYKPFFMLNLTISYT